MHGVVQENISSLARDLRFNELESKTSNPNFASDALEKLIILLYC